SPPTVRLPRHERGRDQPGALQGDGAQALSWHHHALHDRDPGAWPLAPVAEPQLAADGLDSRQAHTRAGFGAVPLLLWPSGAALWFRPQSTQPCVLSLVQ